MHPVQLAVLFATSLTADPIRCDVLIVGGSFGGCAAAIGAAGLDVWVIEDSDWIGGQVSSQGVSALDEHRFIETCGRTREYAAFRVGVRERSGGVRNPGGGWVSRLCFLPDVGRAELEARIGSAGAKVLRESTVVEGVVVDRRVVAVTVRKADGTTLEFAPRYVLDATDTGDFLPLAGIPFHLGSDARADTGEPHAAEHADTARQQSFTFPFAVEFRAGESHRIEKPARYEEFRDSQPYSLTLASPTGSSTKFRFFEKEPGSPGPFWTYRRIAPDVAMINWPGNDYRGRPLVGQDAAHAQDEARLLSLGFLYWLQTECPRDDGGNGYPELLLRPDVMGTTDGLSKRPYVREGRRMIARGTVVEQDLVVDTARARLFSDSVGLGWYPIDVHAAAGESKDRGGLAVPTKPFQIRLSQLVPRDVDNVIAAGKCLDVTHVTNGAYRLHPIEWSAGETAGRLAAQCIAHGILPAQVVEDVIELRAFQVALLRAGVPIFWFTDLTESAPEWVASQALAVWQEAAVAGDELEFRPTAERVAGAMARFAELEARGWRSN